MLGGIVKGLKNRLDSYRDVGDVLKPTLSVCTSVPIMHVYVLMYGLCVSVGIFGILRLRFKSNLGTLEVGNSCFFLLWYHGSSWESLLE